MTPEQIAAGLTEAQPENAGDDDGGCFQCDGEGFVYGGCGWDWQCDTWDGDSCLCTRRCDFCNPAPHNPELDALMSAILQEQPHDRS